MAENIVSQEVPSIYHMQGELMAAMAQIRMMRAYVELHIDNSLEGPNGGNAAADLINTSDCILEKLDLVFNGLDAMSATILAPVLDATAEAAAAIRKANNG
jgi:hypothetical protein